MCYFLMNERHVKVVLWPLILCGLFLMNTSWASERSGEIIYNQSCKQCHGPNQSIALKKGDEAWNRLLNAKGMKRLVRSVKLGTDNMPAGGLCSGCTTNEIREAIHFLRPAIDTIE